MIQKLKFQVQDLSCVRSIVVSYIVSNFVTSELERPMIFFATVRSPCISISKLKMLTFYFNILIEIKFLTTEQYIVCLFDLILYVPSTIFQLYRDGSSWDEPVLS